MSNVTVNFRGICTPSPRGANAALPGAHRVVLLNASGMNVIDGIRIPPHFAKLTISATIFQNPEETSTFLLQGALLQIGAEPQAVQYADDFDNVMPNLTNLAGAIETLGPPSLFVFDPSWPAIAANFDTNQGTFTPTLADDGAVGAKLEMDATEVISPIEPTHILLNVSPFPGAGDPLSPAVPSPLRLRVPATISITNLDPMEEVGPVEHPASHFLLHYILAQTYPSAPQVPQVPPSPRQTFSSGCSDSNYP